MNKFFYCVLVLGTVGFPSLAAGLGIGDTAPDFKISDIRDFTHKLSDYRGRYVVLEWHNQDCPQVKKDYANGRMQTLQKKWTKKMVVWFRVISSPPGTPGYLTELEADASARKQRSLASATFRDIHGILGKKYGATTTPQMFIIDPKGKLIYKGAFDSDQAAVTTPGTPGKGNAYVNYVDQALKESMKGWAITYPTTEPTGCAIQYKN